MSEGKTVARSHLAYGDYSVLFQLISLMLNIMINIVSSAIYDWFKNRH